MISLEPQGRDKRKSQDAGVRASLGNEKRFLIEKKGTLASEGPNCRRTAVPRERAEIER